MTKVHLHENVEEIEVSGPITGHVLRWNGSHWVNAEPSSGSDATKLQSRDISATAPSNLQYLGWNSSTTKWEPKTLPESSGSMAQEQRFITLYVPGYLYIGTKFPRIYFPFSSGSIQFVRCLGGVSYAPTGSSIIFQVRRYGYAGGSSVDVCSATIAINDVVAATETITQPYWTSGFFLQVNVSQVGSVYRGQNLTVSLTGRGIGLPT